MQEKDNQVYSIVLYLFLLSFFVLFKGSPSYFSLCMQSVRQGIPLETHHNFLPFSNLLPYLHDWKNSWLMMNLLVNLLLFIPWGIFIGRRIPSGKWMLVFLAGAGLSLLYEWIQFLTSFGSFDVDDILLNGFGTLIGCGYDRFYHAGGTDTVQNRRWWKPCLWYFLIEIAVNLFYFCSWTGAYYLFHLQKPWCYWIGAVIGLYAGAVLRQKQTAFWRWRQMGKTGIYAGSKIVQLFLMHEVTARLLPSGCGGLTICIALWGMIFIVGYEFSRVSGGKLHKYE